jgi:putative colanic acid biosynthesis UDP-glucose lipid carrier transferase
MLILPVVRFFERSLIKHLRYRGRNIRVFTLVGNDPELMNVYVKLALNPTLGYRVNGYYADEDYKVEEGKKLDFERLGTLKDFIAAVEQNEHIDLGEEVYVCLPKSESRLIRHISNYCDAHVIRFYYVPTSVEKTGIRLKREFLDDIEIFTTHEIPLESSVNKFFKRAFDIVFSFFVVCFEMVFVFPIVALIIKRQSPGPIFFKQLRTGLNGQDFMCYKFRSMAVNSDSDTVQAVKNDPRKFPFGSFMRKYNIDELPQFLNVLKGDMSIVGPRPHMLYHTEVYSRLIQKYMVRHFVKPGITGWAQVSGFRGETHELWQMEERVKRDIWYIEHWTPWLDFRIIWMTLKSFVVHDEQAY